MCDSVMASETLKLGNTEHNEKILNTLLSMSECSCTETVCDFWRFMLVCFSTPRPSTNYDGVVKECRNDRIRSALRMICDFRDLTYKQDQIGNIIIANCDTSISKAKVCFQGHMDVVVSKNESVDHDFDTQGVDVRITPERTLKPIKGITLGADNGVAIACGLAVLCNNRSVPMELLITKNEETDFSGAMGLDPTMVTADIVLNLDSEEESAICVGSAGGFDQTYELPVERESGDLLNPSTDLIYSFKIRHLKGGHSGCDIHQERYNGILAMLRTLLASRDHIRLISFLGGTARNAIPRESDAVLVCDSLETVERIRESFNELHEEIRGRECGVTLEVERVVDELGQAKNSLTLASSVQLINFLCALPNGVMHTVPETHDVQSSLNMGVLRLPADSSTLFIKFLVRSTSESWMHFFSKKLCAIADLAGASSQTLGGIFGAWEPVYDAEVVQRLKATHPTSGGAKNKGPIPRVYTLHAGLECSTIVENFKEVGRIIQCGSIGPQVEGAHSPDECLYIDSAKHFVAWTENFARSL